jgi:hypothetical protein
LPTISTFSENPGNKSKKGDGKKGDGFILSKKGDGFIFAP